MRKRALGLLRTATSNNTAEFRPGQWEAIEALLNRERLLVVERTGWGKSIVYFLATRLLRERGAGCTLLISPLLSLMRNQIEAARRIGVRAETINSSNPDEWQQIEASLVRDQIDVLLVSPERLANDDFINRCLLPVAARIGLFVVDEAHCISDWGHDFRPDYQRIVRILRALPPNIPILATTATANDRVVEDVVTQLGPDLHLIRGPLARTSLRLQTIPAVTKGSRLAWLAQVIPSLPGSGIVYTLTVRDSVVVADWLRSRGIDAQPYHGQMEAAERADLEDRLLQDRVKVLVATVALGMGFDKPNLGFVIHFQRPASAVHYYQQVGRAGREIDLAYGVLLGGQEDDEIAEYFMRSAFPTEEEVTEVLEALRRSRGALTSPALEREVNLRRSKLEQVLKFLLLESPAPIQKSAQGYARNPVRWEMPRARIERILALRRAEQERMQEFMMTEECLMQFLSRELNDPEAGQCGKCVNCSPPVLDTNVSPELVNAANEFLNNLSIPIEPRKQWPSGMTFEGSRGRIPVEQQLQQGRALCRWGDSGFGEMVRQGKQTDGRFCAELVTAAAQAIRSWGPEPQPAWVTCVPSRRHTRLVETFARQLAEVLGLPFVACIRKVRETEPQKTRQNTHQQVTNLENVFEVDAQQVRPTPLLLIDDMVDSRWTFTVLGVKLLQAGSGAVFPFALADSSAGTGD
jgi:ATP-dependent DNA helicase RecQ